MDNTITNYQTKKPVLTKDQVMAIAGMNGENLTLTRKRLEGLESFLDTPLPDRVGHLWRYSDPAVFMPSGPIEPRQVTFSKELLTTTENNNVGIVLLPGSNPIITLDAEARDAGIEILPLAVAKHGAERLGEAVPAGHGLFEALNTAIWSAGVFVRIPRGFELERAIRIAHVASAAIVTTRVLVVVEGGAKVNLVEEHLGGAPGRKVISASELLLERNAELNHALVQRWNDGTVGHVTTRANLGSDARFRSAVISIGASNYKADLGAVLGGSGANSEFIGVAFGDLRQQLDHHTVHHHRASNTLSNLGFKVALNGRARSAYTGLIRIEEEARHSEAYQECRNLLLSDRCEADSIPELEIKTDEVRCTHGATSGPVDDEQLFYLRSRGITADEALRIVVRGFLEETISRVPGGLRSDIKRMVDERLDRISQGGKS